MRGRMSRLPSHGDRPERNTVNDRRTQLKARGSIRPVFTAGRVRTERPVSALSKRFAVRAALSIAILAWVVYATDATAILATIRGADERYLLLAVGLYLASDLLSAKKLEILLRIPEIRLASVWRYYYIGKLFNSFLPTTIGGDAVKARKIERRFDDFNAYSAVFMERFTGFVALLGIAVIATTVFAQPVPRFVYAAVYGVFLPSVLAVSALLWVEELSSYLRGTIRRVPGAGAFGIGERVVEFHATVEEYKSTRSVVVLALALSLAFHALLITTCVIFGAGVGMAVHPVYFFVFIPVASLILFLPVSIGGFGVREAIYLAFFTQVGATQAEAVSLALFLNGMLVASAAIGGVVYTTE